MQDGSNTETGGQQRVLNIALLMPPACIHELQRRAEEGLVCHPHRTHAFIQSRDGEQSVICDRVFYVTRVLYVTSVICDKVLYMTD